MTTFFPACESFAANRLPEAPAPTMTTMALFKLWVHHLQSITRFLLLRDLFKGAWLVLDQAPEGRLLSGAWLNLYEFASHHTSA
jgi:hypothetical protein